MQGTASADSHGGELILSHDYLGMSRSYQRHTYHHLCVQSRSIACTGLRDQVPMFVSRDHYTALRAVQHPSMTPLFVIWAALGRSVVQSMSWTGCGIIGALMV